MTYTPPSKCDRCVPTETLASDSGLTWTIEAAHQTTCPNHPHHTEAQA
ncbi:hypothetical protein [Arthrobacter sp. ISL-69]|nr:hypothetical protein [Arthrobacter sp. ISL-69]MBT2538772.1 hypothetical protein [Arthrobacter sp. ISL-69]